MNLVNYYLHSRDKYWAAHHPPINTPKQEEPKPSEESKQFVNIVLGHSDSFNVDALVRVLKRDPLFSPHLDEISLLEALRLLNAYGNHLKGNPLSLPLLQLVMTLYLSAKQIGAENRWIFTANYLQNLPTSFDQHGKALYELATVLEFYALGDYFEKRVSCEEVLGKLLAVAEINEKVGLPHELDRLVQMSVQLFKATALVDRDYSGHICIANGSHLELAPASRIRFHALEQLCTDSVSVYEEKTGKIEERALESFRAVFGKCYRKGNVTQEEVDQLKSRIQQLSNELMNDPGPLSLGKYRPLKQQFRDVIFLLEKNQEEIRRWELKGAFTLFRKNYLMVFAREKMSAKMNGFEPLDHLKIQWVHGTKSSIFAGLVQTQYQLVPSGELKKRNVVAFCGENFEGVGDEGINHGSLSVYDLYHAEGSVKYAEEEIYGFDLASSYYRLRSFQNVQYDFGNSTCYYSFLDIRVFSNALSCMQRILAFDGKTESIRWDQLALRNQQWMETIHRQLNNGDKAYLNFYHDILSSLNEMNRIIQDPPPRLSEMQKQHLISPFPMVFASTKKQQDYLHQHQDLSEGYVEGSIDLKTEVDYLFVPSKHLQQARQLLDQHQLKMEVLPFDALVSASKMCQTLTLYLKNVTEKKLTAFRIYDTLKSKDRFLSSAAKRIRTLLTAK